MKPVVIDDPKPTPAPEPAPEPKPEPKTGPKKDADGDKDGDDASDGSKDDSAAFLNESKGNHNQHNKDGKKKSISDEDNYDKHDVVSGSSESDSDRERLRILRKINKKYHQVFGSQSLNSQELAKQGQRKCKSNFFYNLNFINLIFLFKMFSNVQLTMELFMTSRANQVAKIKVAARLLSTLAK